MLQNKLHVCCCAFFRTLRYARAEPLRERVFHVEQTPYIENKFDVREFKNFTSANGKRQTANVRFKLRMSRKNQRITILMDKKLRKTTNLGVEIMNSKRQVKRKRGHVVQIRVCRLT